MTHLRDVWSQMLPIRLSSNPVLGAGFANVPLGSAPGGFSWRQVFGYFSRRHLCSKGKSARSGFPGVTQLCSLKESTDYTQRSHRDLISALF